MAGCKDCLHIDVCKMKEAAEKFLPEAIENNSCDCFKDRSKFIELPCNFDLDEVAELYEDMMKYGIRYKTNGALGREILGTGDLLLDSAAILKTVFLTKEEAEKALEEL